MKSKTEKGTALAVMCFIAALAAGAFAAAPPPAVPSAPPLPPAPILYILKGDLKTPIPEQTINISAEGGISYYRAPLEGAREAAAPVKILDLSPLNLKPVKLKEDGLIFSWIEGTFDESIYFIEEDYEQKGVDHFIRSPRTEGPGLYAYIEVKATGVGKACFVFRIVP